MILLLLFTNDVIICMKLDLDIDIGSIWFCFKTGCDTLLLLYVWNGFYGRRTNPVCFYGHRRSLELRMNVNPIRFYALDDDPCIQRKSNRIRHV
jgi:hypothetical protein